jgi:DNA-binding transcriptional ArsR family regulator
MSAQDLSAHSEEVSAMLKSLAHPVRLKVLCFLIEGEKSVNDIVEYCGVSQSGISQFLGRMRLEGLVEARKEGSFVYYGIADKRLIKLMGFLKDTYCSKPRRN